MIRINGLKIQQGRPGTKAGSFEVILGRGLNTPNAKLHKTFENKIIFTLNFRFLNSLKLSLGCIICTVFRHSCLLHPFCIFRCHLVFFRLKSPIKFGYIL